MRTYPSRTIVHPSFAFSPSKKVFRNGLFTTREYYKPRTPVSPRPGGPAAVPLDPDFANRGAARARGILRPGQETRRARLGAGSR
jgi:hypothetical protein